MSKILRLYNTFVRNINEVQLNGKLLKAGNDEVKHGSLYICGPTVYSDSHMGHAITYVRADLFRRLMKSVFNVRLTTVMNITDVDDKILAKAQEELGKAESNDANSLRSSNDAIAGEKSDTDKANRSRANYTEPGRHMFNKISEKYHRSFLKDMELIRVRPADLTIKVTKQIPLIIDYIKKLEQRNHAYIAENGDIYFSVASVAGYEGRVDDRKSAESFDPSKRDKRDFVLWKAAKPNEPVWMYKSDVTGKSVPGRPGWHVQCSAISNLIFGDKLDFHYGGKDLIFPHHYNEEACCCAYHNLDTSKTMHVWSRNWLHSGHLILREEKMSKSVGNVIGINNFINSSSVNALRLLCITSHYRSNVDFSQDLLDNLKSLDHKLKAFTSYLNEEILRHQNETFLPISCEELSPEDKMAEVCDYNDSDVSLSISRTHEDIIEGTCDDLDLDKGLQSILNLARLIYSKGSGRVKAQDLVAAMDLLKDWCETCGLEYDLLEAPQDELLVELMQSYRQNVRSLVVNELRNKQPNESSRQILLKSLLTECDNVRARLDELGLVIRDKKT